MMRKDDDDAAAWVMMVLWAVLIIGSCEGWGGL